MNKYLIYLSILFVIFLDFFPVNLFSQEEEAEGIFIYEYNMIHAQNCDTLMKVLYSSDGRRKKQIIIPEFYSGLIGETDTLTDVKDLDFGFHFYKYGFEIYSYEDPKLLPDGKCATVDIHVRFYCESFIVLEKWMPTSDGTEKGASLLPNEDCKKTIDHWNSYAREHHMKHIKDALEILNATNEVWGEKTFNITGCGDTEISRQIDILKKELKIEKKAQSVMDSMTEKAKLKSIQYDNDEAKKGAIPLKCEKCN